MISPFVLDSRSRWNFYNQFFFSLIFHFPVMFVLSMGTTGCISIRIAFNADPDPPFYLNADPDPGRIHADPGQTLTSQRVGFWNENDHLCR